MLKHFTATAYIVSKIDGEYRVLLHKHKKHGLWIGIGGHIEKDENPVQALIREVKEETNLDILLLNEDKLIKVKNVKQLPVPDVILEEKLSAYKNEPSHYHIDLIYFAFCKNPQKIKMNEEFAWFSKKDLKKIKIRKEVAYLCYELFKSLKQNGLQYNAIA